jgi:hypothetical protein
MKNPAAKKAAARPGPRVTATAAGCRPLSPTDLHMPSSKGMVIGFWIVG